VTYLLTVHYNASLKVVVLILKVGTDETTTLHETIRTMIALENYNNNNQYFYLDPRA